MFKWLKRLFSGEDEKCPHCHQYPDKPLVEEGDGWRREGAHVLVGTERPLAKVFRFSGESDESFNKRKLQAIEDEAREMLKEVFKK